MITALPTAAWFMKGMRDEDARIQKSRRETYAAIQQAINDIAATGREPTPEEIEGVLDQYRTTDSWLTGAIPAQSIIDGIQSRASEKAAMVKSEQALRQMEQQQKEQQIIASIVTTLPPDAKPEDVTKRFIDTFGEQVGSALFTKHAGAIPKIQAEARMAHTAKAIDTYGKVVNDASQVDQWLSEGLIDKTQADALRNLASQKDGQVKDAVAATFSTRDGAILFKQNPEQARSIIASDYRLKTGRDATPDVVSDIYNRAKGKADALYALHKEDERAKDARENAATERAQHIAEAQFIESQIAVQREVWANAKTPEEKSKALQEASRLQARMQKLMKFGGDYNPDDIVQTNFNAYAAKVGAQSQQSVLESLRLTDAQTHATFAQALKGKREMALLDQLGFTTDGRDGVRTVIAPVIQAFGGVEPAMTALTDAAKSGDPAKIEQFKNKVLIEHGAQLVRAMSALGRGPAAQPAQETVQPRSTLPGAGNPQGAPRSQPPQAQPQVETQESANLMRAVTDPTVMSLKQQYMASLRSPNAGAQLAAIAARIDAHGRSMYGIPNLSAVIFQQR